MVALASYAGVIPGAERSKQAPRLPAVVPSREQNRRQPLAAVDGRLVRRPPSLEELHELLARAVILPLAIAPDDLDEVVDRLRPAALAVQRHREVEPRLMVEWIVCDLLLEVSERTHR